MNSVWQLQVAKNRLSELVDAAVLNGAQIITRHGKPVVKVVPLSGAEVEAGKALPSLEGCLLNAPRGTALPAMPRRTAKKPFNFET
jgi:antitoxin Phd